MSRKKRNFDLTPKQGHTQMVARQSYLLRRGVRRHGSVERLNKTQESVFRVRGRPKRIRSFQIPGFELWHLAETPHLWIIQPPKGRNGTARLGDNPEFRGETITRDPVGGKTPLERIARHTASGLRRALSELGSSSFRGESYTGSREWGVWIMGGVIFITKRPPRVERRPWSLAKKLLGMLTPHIPVSKGAIVGYQTLPTGSERVAPPREGWEWRPLDI